MEYIYKSISFSDFPCHLSGSSLIKHKGKKEKKRMGVPPRQSEVFCFNLSALNLWPINQKRKREDKYFKSDARERRIKR
jgi:hypothetical protein